MKGTYNLFIVGESSKRYWDLSLALLGYPPKFQLEELGYSFRDELSSYSKPGVVIGEIY